MKSLTIVLALVLASLPAAPLAAQTPQPSKALSGTVTLAEVKLTASVEAVDVAKRLLTLRRSDGSVRTFQVDAAVKNLAQIRKGDTITIAYYESLLWEVRKPGSPSPAAAENRKITTEPGAKPRAAITREITATVTIMAIDPTAPSVTVKQADQPEHTIKVLHPENLKSVKVGDKLDIRYTEALVIAAEEVAIKK